MQAQLNNGQLVSRYFGSKAEAEEALESFRQSQEDDIRGGVWLYRTSPELWTVRVTSQDEDGYSQFLGFLQPV